MGNKFAKSQCWSALVSFARACMNCIRIHCKNGTFSGGNAMECGRRSTGEQSAEQWYLTMNGNYLPMFTSGVNVLDHRRKKSWLWLRTRVSAVLERSSEGWMGMNRENSGRRSTNAPEQSRNCGGRSTCSRTRMFLPVTSMSLSCVFWQGQPMSAPICQVQPSMLSLNWR